MHHRQTQIPPHKSPPLNVPIHVEFTTTKNVLESAIEAELGALFVNCQRGYAQIISLKEMVHRQPLTPLTIDSATSDGFVNDSIRQQKSRAIDMIFYWVRYRVIQVHYLVYWARVKDNLADHFTKHHPTKHHRSTRVT